MATATKKVTARYEVPACIRCGAPIKIGAPVEQWVTPHGKKRWVHEGCTTSAAWSNGAGPADGDGVGEDRVRQLVRAEVDSQLAKWSIDKSGGGKGLSETDVAVRINTRLVDFKRELDGAVISSLDMMAGKITEVINANNQCVQSVNEVRKLYEEMDKARRVVIEIRKPDHEPIEITDHVHPVFTDVLFHLEAGDHVMLVGPTGCGKTHLAMAVAKHLKLNFTMVSCSVGLTESAIFGSREPASSGKGFEYHLSDYCKSYRDGGLHLWDEVDALDPNVFLSVNAAMSNDLLTMPKNYQESQISRHQSHVCIAAANTYGNGADRQYVGRNQLDGASIDRFVFIPMDYDEQLERQLVVARLGTDPGESLVARLQEYRQRARAAGIRRNISTRFILRAANWIAMGKDSNYVKHKLFESWKPEERSKVGA